MTADRSASSGDPISDFFLENPRKLDDPFADLAWLREHRPVHWHEPFSQWFVFPYDEVQSLFSDKRLSADRVAGFVDAVPKTLRDQVRTLLPYLEKWLIFRDGADHAQLRTILHRGFNAKAIRQGDRTAPRPCSDDCARGPVPPRRRPAETRGQSRDPVVLKRREPRTGDSSGQIPVKRFGASPAPLAGPAPAGKAHRFEAAGERRASTEESY